MTEITFDLEELRKFIDYIEVDHYGRCGDKYYEVFRLTDDGIIEHKYKSFDFRMEEGAKEWKPYEDDGIIKGVIHQ